MSSTDGNTPKVSGLKPPTKISRPCSVTPKPALPTAATPRSTNNGSISVVRRESVPRRKMAGLEDVYEEEDSELGDKSPDEERRLSRGSVFSDASGSQSGRMDVNEKKKKSSDPDSLWEHARRLSEAGVRRTSDASIVLTEDTDSFIIGDKVWVGGTKPGQIAYIGDTQFAPGEWAGIVLDDPIGKNDGSVAGIRYFQCEPKRGVFSRLTRLTREPLSQADGASTTGEQSPLSKMSDNLSLRSSTSQSLSSPTGSTKDLVLKKSSTSITHGSPGSSSISQATSDLKIGDRVIVMSSLGSKAGILRYMGMTDFAPGEWCGVELDDPLGKNDGSVGDRRYFQCQPKCGLFAPVHKVSRSPASRRPSSCALHRSTQASGIRRAGSRESVTSVNSSIASSVRSARVRLGVTSLGTISQRTGAHTPTTTPRPTLKDALKEKDIQIEKLLRERDLERAEVTRAATQADEAEQKLSSVMKEFKKYQEDTETRLKEHQDLLARVQQEKGELLSQLEDEKRRVEDLQFQFEEETIYKTDIEMVNATHEENIRLLEQKLSEERQKCEVLEHDSNKLFEAEESLARYKEEVEVLRKELDEVKKCLKEKIDTPSTENNKTIEALQKKLEAVQHSMESGEAQAKEHEKDHERKMEVLRKQLEEKLLMEGLHNREIEVCNTNIKQKSEELDTALSTLKEKNLEIDRLKKKLEAAETSIQQMTQNLEGMVSLTNQKEEDLKKNLDEKERLLEVRDLLKTELEAKLAVEELYKTENEVYKMNIKQKSEELDTALSALKEKALEIDGLKKKLEAAETSILQMTQNLEGMVSLTNQKEDDLKKNLDEKERLLEVRELELKQAAEKHTQEMIERNNVVIKLEDDVKTRDSEIIKLRNDLTVLKEDLLISSEEMKQSHLKEIEEKVVEIRTLKALIDQKDAEIHQLSEKAEKFERELQSKVEMIEKLEADIRGLNDKLIASEQSMMVLTKEVQKLQLEIGDSQRKLQATEEKVELLTLQKNKLENDIAEMALSSHNSSEQTCKLMSDLREVEKELNHAKEELISSNQEHENTKHRLQQDCEQYAKSEKDLNEKLTNCREKLDKMEQDLKYERATKLELQQELEKATELCKSIKNEAKANVLQMEMKADSIQHELNTILDKAKKDKKELAETMENFRLEADITTQNLTSEVQNLTQKLQVLEGELMKKCSEVGILEEEHKKQVQRISEESTRKELSLAEELETLKQTICSLEELTSRKDVELVSAVSKQTELQNNIKDIKLALSEKEKLISELKEKVSKLEIENIDMRNSLQEIQNLKEHVSKLKNEKDLILCEMQAQNRKLISMDEEMNNLKGEKSALELELSQIIERAARVTAEFESVKQNERNSNELLVEREKEITRLSKEITQLLEEKEEANISLNNLATEFKKLTEEKLAAEQLSIERNDKINSLTQDVTKLQENLEKHKNELHSKLEQTQEEAKTIQEMQSSLESERIRINTLQEELNQTATERDQLFDKYKLLEGKSQELCIMESSVSTLQKEVQDLRERTEKQSVEISELMQREVVLTSDIGQKEKLNDKLMTEMVAEKERGKQYRETIAKLELDIYNKSKIEKEESVAIPQTKNGQDEQDENFLKNERNFLNSVIVDQQKKIDELKAHIELLNRGITPSDAKDLVLEGIVDRVVAPRQYCDICDVFDAHETEDCPRQSTESPPPHPKHKPGTRTELAERPYCEICEVFGHTTADCDDAETF